MGQTYIYIYMIHVAHQFSGVLFISCSVGFLRPTGPSPEPRVPRVRLGRVRLGDTEVSQLQEPITGDPRTARLRAVPRACAPATGGAR